MSSIATKRSKQRERIYQVLKRTKSHPTAEWIFKQVRVQMPKISLGTVYRNLHVLREQGRIHELDFGEGIRRYDAIVEQHYHFICTKCGTITDLDMIPVNIIDEQVKKVVPGVVQSHRLDYMGICTSCLQNS